jgi:hypothetical protein
MTKKKEESAPAPKPFVSRSAAFKTLYVTGAIGSFSPFDYRLTFYNHEEQWPEKPSQVSTVPISQVMQITLVMSPDLAERLKDLLDLQLKEKEKTQKSKEGEKRV